MDMNFVVEFYKVFGGPKSLTPEELKNFNEELRSDQITPNTNNFDGKQTYAVKSGKHENILDRLFGLNMWSAHVVPGTSVTTVSKQVVRDKDTKMPLYNKDGSEKTRDNFSCRAEVVFMVPSRGIIHTFIGASDNTNRNYAETGVVTAALSLILKRVAPGVRLLWENELSEESTPKSSYQHQAQPSTKDTPSNSSTHPFKWLNPDAKHDSDEYRQWLNYLNAFKASNQTPQQFRTSQIPEGYNLANKYLVLLVK